MRTCLLGSVQYPRRSRTAIFNRLIEAAGGEGYRRFCMRSSMISFRRCLGVWMALACAPLLAANYPLELVSPRAAGTAPSSDAGTPAMPSGHRIFYAYPGIAYNIRAVVIAGAYPYAFALSNAPSGMTINSVTGEINWPNPQANATPTITVTDAEGTQRSASWTITVGTGPFKFVDSQNGNDSNAGTLQAPWRTLAGVKAGSRVGDIVYFRTGTYTTLGMQVENPASGEFQPAGNWQRVSFAAPRWIAYPGETPIYDGGHQANVRQGNILVFGGTATTPSYIEGFQLRNMWHMGLQFASGSCDYPVFRNLSFNGPAVWVDGANSAGIMTTGSYTDPTFYAAYQRLSQTNGASGLVKQYSHKKHLWEEFDIRNSNFGPDQKLHVPRFEIRKSVITTNSSLEYGGLFGNQQYGSGGVGENASGEIRFNLIDRRNVGEGNLAVDMNQGAETRNLYVYRNTLLGGVRVRGADSPDGPFRIYQNVIVNTVSGTPAGSHITHAGVTDPSRIIASDNLVGYPQDNLVTADGTLAPSQQQWLGTRGHQIGNEIRPRPPTAVTAQ